MPSLRMWWVNCFAAALSALALAPALAEPAGPSSGGWNGTFRGRILDERFRHRQSERSAPALAALSDSSRVRLLDDRGDIAVIDTSGGVLASPNFFDLAGSTLRFTPTPEGLDGAAEALAFDGVARDNGVPLALGDDDDAAILLPFTFPFYGADYSEVFVNSDGNLTFGEPDGATGPRSLSRALSGAPRVAPFFVDLDPSRTAAQVRVYSVADRVVITWDGVPLFGASRRHTFQAELASDGSIVFHYLSASVSAVVVGVFPGGGADPVAADFSQGFTGLGGGAAELFQLSSNLDIFVAAQRFYANHDDAYDFIILFNNLGVAPGPGSFAFEVNVRNEVLGIGDLLFPDPVFDFGPDFGSARRLTSFVNMGPLSAYPENPTEVIPIIGENSTLSVMGQEIGHRWLVYLSFIDPVTGLPSTSIVGRQAAHWSFFFNSDASVVEGNRIIDRGPQVSPRFETVATVERFSEFDQYVMGLIGPEEVPASFVVEQPTGGGSTNASRAPQTGVTFDGVRKQVTIESLIGAEGPRRPNTAVAQKEFRFAFVVVVDEDSPELSEAEFAKIDRIRTQWVSFFEGAVDQRAVGSAALVEMLRLSAWPAAGVLSGGEGEVEVSVSQASETDLLIGLTSDSSVIAIPDAVTISAGGTSARFRLTGAAPGVAVLRAEATRPGVETATARINVLADPSELEVVIESGAGQAGVAGQALPEPIVVRVVDVNRTPYVGVPLIAAASADGVADAGAGSTDADGRGGISWTLSSGGAPEELRVSVAGGGAAGTVVLAESSAVSVSLSAEGVVNSASYNTGQANVGLAPGGLISIFGAGLSNQSKAADGFPLPRSLAGTRVFVNGTPVPLLFVSPVQINLQLPLALVGADVEIVVRTAFGDSEPVALPAAPTQPGLFFDGATGLVAARLPADGQTAWSRAARPGEFLELFAAGLGAVEPLPETGAAASRFFLSNTLAEATVLLDQQRLVPTFAGLAPGFAGLYQINVQLPADLAPGRYEISIEIDGRLSNVAVVDVE